MVSAVVSESTWRTVPCQTANCKEQQSVAAQTNLALMAPSVAHTFLWKDEEPDDRKCKLLAGIIKALITSRWLLSLPLLPLRPSLQ